MPELCIICAQELTIFTRGAQFHEEIRRLKITFCDMMGMSGSSEASDLISHQLNPFCIHCIRPIIATQKAVILFRLKMGLASLISPPNNGLPGVESSSSAVESNISKSPLSPVKAPKFPKAISQPLNSPRDSPQPLKRTPKSPELSQMKSGLNDIEINELGSDEEGSVKVAGVIEIDEGSGIEFIGDSDDDEGGGLASIEVKKDEVEEEGAEGSKNEPKTQDFDSDSTDFSDVESSDSGGEDDSSDEDYKFENYYQKTSLKGYNPSGKKFSCRICGDEFRRRQGLVRHEKLHKKGRKRFSEGVLVKSNGDQVDRSEYGCSVCSRLFYNQTLLDKHIDQEHARKAPKNPLGPSETPSTIVSVKCSICKKPHVGNKDDVRLRLKTHEATHDPRSYFQCPVCPIKRDMLGYSSKSHMLRHFRSSHPERHIDDLETLPQDPEMPKLRLAVTEPPPDEEEEGVSPKKCIKADCRLCKKNFSGTGYLKRHMNLVHHRRST